MAPPPPQAAVLSNLESDPLLSTDDVSSGDDSLLFSDDEDDSDSEMGDYPPSIQAENEKFGSEYQGPKMTDDEASRLLQLILHASTCPCE